MPRIIFQKEASFSAEPKHVPMRQPKQEPMEPWAIIPAVIVFGIVSFIVGGCMFG